MIRILNQTGATILQGLLLSTVVAGSALIATKVFEDQKKTLKGVETRDQIEQLHRIVYSVLQNRENCFATYWANMPGNDMTFTVGTTSPSTTPFTTILSKTGASSTQTAFQVHGGSINNTYMNGNVLIESMTMIRPYTSDPDPAKRLKTYPSTLQIDYSRLQGSDPTKRTKSGYGAKRIRKNIPILFQFDQAGNVSSCYAVQTANNTQGIADGNNNLNQEFCSSLGENGSMYVWDSQANKCVLKNNICPPKFVFAGILSTGETDCRPLTDYLPYLVNTDGASNCNTAAGATVQLTVGGDGKVALQCISGGGGASCTAPWGATVAHGSCVDAYSGTSANNCSAGTFPYCRSCWDHLRQSRCCNNGTLGGTYTNQNCSDFCGGGMSCI